MSEVPITYQQLLAQQYEENARDLLVYEETDFNNVESHIEEHNASDNVGEQLVDPQEFQHFAGNRASENVILKIKEYEDRGENSVRYAKDVKKVIVNIDTHFRAFASGGLIPVDQSLTLNQNYKSPNTPTATATTSHFIFNLDSQYKNIISAKLSSFQLPNKFFNLIDYRNNYYIYTRKGLFADPFQIPISSIVPNRAGTSATITFSTPIHPLVVNDSITISGAANPVYNNTFIITSSTNSNVTINITNGPTESTTSAILSVYPNSTNSLAGYTEVAVFITNVNQNPRSTFNKVSNDEVKGQSGYYYSNTSIFPALNNAYSSMFPDLSFSLADGYCTISNSSTTQAYTINLTPESVGIYPPYFSTLGAMLGYYNYIYQIQPANLNPPLPPCNFGCGQISACTTYGSIISENKVDMNADPYIQLVIEDWENIYQQDGADTYYSVFQKIPIVNVPKGDVIYDVQYINSISKKYNFQQPENIRYLEITLFDMLGYELLMPGVDWTMTIELEEVLNSSLYDKLREL
jgi:hypothetical protein